MNPVDRLVAVGKLVVDGVRQTSTAATEGADSVVKRGRLAFVTKVLKSVEESRDPTFARRKEAAEELERIQVEMFRGFERVVNLFHEVGTEFETITRLLEQFRAAVAVHNHDPTGGLMLSPGDEPRVRKLDDDLGSNATRLITLAEDASQTLKNSCAHIIQESLNQLRVDGRAATNAVREAQVAMDLARSDLVSAQSYASTLEAGASEGRSRGRVSRLDDSSMDVVRARQLCSKREAALAMKKGAYEQALGVNQTKLDYVLDQVAMATWSCFNVFFTEVSNFFSHGTPLAETLAKSIRDLKNLQAFAKQLTRERRERLDREYLENTQRATPAAAAAGPTFDEAASPAGRSSGNMAHSRSFFDDQAASPEPSMAVATGGTAEAPRQTSGAQQHRPPPPPQGQPQWDSPAAGTDFFAQGHSNAPPSAPRASASPVADKKLDFDDLFS